MKDGDFGFGIKIGAILGFALAIWTAIGVAVLSPAGTFDQYQGFIGGLLATCGALFGGWAVMTQTRSHRQTNSQQKAEALRAQRAGLAFACSELSQYCRECVAALAKDPPQDPNYTLLGGRVYFPEISIRAVDNFVALASVCDQSTAKAIAHLLRRLQTQRSRLVDVEKAINSDGDRQHLQPYHMNDRIYDALEVMSYLDSFFEYADFERDTVDSELRLDRLRAQVNLNRLHGARFDELRNMIQRRHPDHNFAW